MLQRTCFAPADATECVTINAAAVIRLTAQYRGSPPSTLVVVARVGRQHLPQKCRSNCTLRTNRPESRTRFAEMTEVTEVIATDAGK